MRTGFWWGNKKERDSLVDLGIRYDGNIKMDIKEIEWEDVDWIDLAQDRKLQWILGFCNMLGIWLAEDLLASLEGLWS
jgi:hypothetical protein